MKRFLGFARNGELVEPYLYDKLRAVLIAWARRRLAWIVRNIWAIWVGFVIGGSFVWFLFRVVR